MVSSLPGQAHRVLRVGLLAGITLCLLIAGYSFLHYPAMLTPLSSGLIFLALFVAALVGYMIIALQWTRPTTPATTLARRLGARWGLVIGGLWLVEVIAGNLVAPTQPWMLPAYYGAAYLAYLLPLLAGFLGARHTGRISTGALSGLWSGLVSGLITFLALMLIIYLFMNVARHDPQNISQFQHSQAPDLTTFIVGDALAGAINHLLFIGPLLGTLTGTIGGVIGHALARPQPPARQADEHPSHLSA